MLETTNISVLINELLEIEHGRVQRRTSVTNAHALYVALSKCKELVQVTDEMFNIQFVNKATERHLGFKNEELKGKPISEIHQGSDYTNQIARHQGRGKEWEGSVICYRKGSEPVSVLCRVVGASINSGCVILNLIFSVLLNN